LWAPVLEPISRITVCATLPCFSRCKVLSSDTSYMTSSMLELRARRSVSTMAAVISLRVLLPISRMLTVIICPSGSSMGMDTSMWSKYFRHPRTRRRLNSRCVFMDGAAFNPSQMIFIITVFRVIFSSRLLQLAFNALTTGKISVTSASYITMAWGISRQLSVVMLDTILRAMPKCSSLISAIVSPFAWVLYG